MKTMGLYVDSEVARKFDYGQVIAEARMSEREAKGQNTSTFRPKYPVPEITGNNAGNSPGNNDAEITEIRVLFASG